MTSLGLLELRVPRDREGEYQPDCFERYKRVQRQVDEGIEAMFLRGVSTRKVGEVLEAMCGERVSASPFGSNSDYVSKVTKALDEEVARFRNSPIEDDFVFLFLDALSVRVRLELEMKRYSVHEFCVLRLVAYGIRRDGSRKLISFQLTKKESKARWFSFLENLY